jgi:tripartite-type tricarboxylate transporter receptor subunit TctC
MKKIIISFVVFFACNLYAQDSFPNKPIHVVVPFAPGASDVQIRALAPLLSARLGQPIIIDNMPGGGGVIAANAVKLSKPDGYTLFFTGMATLTMVPSLRKDINYSLKDFSPLGNISSITGVMIVHPSNNYKNLKELIQYARDNPGKLNYGTPGIGTAGHTFAVGPQVYGDFLLTHIPYKGGSEVMTAVIGANVDVGFVLPNIAMPHLQAGSVKAFAVTASKRSEFLPDVPTYRELGINYVDGESYGILGPKDLPTNIVSKISSAIAEACADTNFKDLMRKSAISVEYLNQDQYKSLLLDREVAWNQHLNNPKFLDLIKK